jgi:hypothetical protein
MRGPVIMGGLDLSPEGQQRSIDIAAHLVSVVSHRGLTPAERLLALMTAAGAVVCSAVPAQDRRGGFELGAALFGNAIQGAGQAMDSALARMPVDGSA